MKTTKAKLKPTRPTYHPRRHRKPITIKIDKHIGLRIRFRRKMLKMSQADVGEKLGISYQQIQKYEKGVNRISSGTLFIISKILTVPASYFYDGFEEIVDDKIVSGGDGVEEV